MKVTEAIIKIRYMTVKEPQYTHPELEALSTKMQLLPLTMGATTSSLEVVMSRTVEAEEPSILTPPPTGRKP